MMRSVLIVDDERLIRKGLQKLIDWNGCGWKIAGEAENGAEALDFLKSHTVDLVITDLMMPGVDGIALSEQMRDHYADTDILVLTGYDDFELVQKSIRNQVQDYLLKPIDATQLIETLARIGKHRDEKQMPFPFQLESELQCALEQNSTEAIGEAVEALMKFFARYRDEPERTRQVLEAIRNGHEHYFKQKGYVISRCYPEIPSAFTQAQLHTILTDTMESVRKTIHVDAGDELIPRIKAYVEDRISEDISLTSLARTFFVNASYLSNLFKDKTGVNYSEYIAGIRLHEAKKLIQNSSYSLGEIAEKVGYPDQRYFSQFFKRHTGRTPSAYRREMIRKGGRSQ